MNIDNNDLKLVDLLPEISANGVEDHFRNSNSTEVLEQLTTKNQSTFNENSSVSSTYSPHTPSHSLSVASVQKTHSSVKTSKSVHLCRRCLIQGDNVQEGNINEENDQSIQGKNDYVSSQSSNSSANEEVVKITDASTLDLASIVHIEPPRIKDYPQIIRPQNEPNQYLDQTSFVMQLNCDQHKLINSSVIKNHTKEDRITNINPCINSPVNIHQIFISKEIQTLPVLILPIQDEDDITMNNRLEGYSKHTDKLQIKLNHQETQVPAILTERIKTHSDKTRQSKDRDNTDIQIELSQKTINDEAGEIDGPDEFWGNFYNDYKKLSQNINKVYFLKTNNKTKTSKFNTKEDDYSLLAGDFLKKSLGALKKKKKKKKTVNFYSSRPGLKSEVFRNKTIKTNIKGPNEKILTDSDNFQRFYEVSQFDEIAKSYLSPLDRRIKSICTKIGCKIRMYGPIVRWHTNDTKLLQAASRMKTFYYIIVGAFTKERLNKSIKCIQETFPKAYLNQKYNGRFLSKNLGKEIPI